MKPASANQKLIHQKLFFFYFFNVRRRRVGRDLSLKVVRQPSQKLWPKILTLYFFYCNLYLHFLRPFGENIFNIVFIVLEKSGK